MKDTVIILGSSRSKGNTSRIVDYINEKYNIDVIDLNRYKIGYFDYDFKNMNDDFIPLMRKIIKNYNNLVFATPVYWYNMSGILKVFFDRFSDLLHYEKDLGRKLRGKNMAMISCSNSNDLKEGFAAPFIASSNYLGMHYLGEIHTWLNANEISPEVKEKIDTFITEVTNTN